MAHLTLPPGFGENSWFDDTWAKANAVSNPPFAVADPGSWAPSINAGATRRINVAVGRAWCCGVWDETDAVEPVDFAANTGGSDRLDALVARYVWATNSITFTTIPGTTSPPAINANGIVDPAKINRIPGDRYEAVLGLVKVRPGVDIFQPSDLLADLRTWAGVAGPLVTAATAYRDLIHVPVGGQLLDGTGQLWRNNAGSLVSQTRTSIRATDYTSGGVTNSTGQTPLAAATITVTSQDVQEGRRLRVGVRGNFGTGGASPYVGARVDGAALDPNEAECRLDGRVSWWFASAPLTVAGDKDVTVYYRSHTSGTNVSAGAVKVTYEVV